MKKQTIKRGWLLGLLIGLVMMVGASPAIAGYIFVGDFYNAGFAGYTANGINNQQTWSSNVAPPLYQYTQSQDFYVDSVMQTGDKDENPSDGWGVWNGLYEYVIIKQGSYGSGFADLYKYSATGTDLVNLDKYYSDGEFKISHISGYNAIPIPGAVWLLGSGLGALLVARRRRK